MAEKKSEVKTEEKIFTVPLRSAWKPARRIEKTKKSVKAVREYVSNHTRTAEVSISEKLNTVLWSGGAKKPLHTVKIKVNLAGGKASAMLPDEITFDEEKKKFLEKETKKAEKKAEEQLKPEEGKADAKVAPAPVTEESEEEKKQEEPKTEDKPKDEPKKK